MTTKDVLLDNKILQIVNGSRLYGTNTPESDEDFVGVYVEPAETVFLGRQEQSVNLHDRGPHDPSGVNEIDGVAYSLRHFISLTAKGNPTTLSLLFAPDDKVVFSTSYGSYLLSQRELFVSQLAAPRFAGYMLSQLKRLKGEKKGHIPNRQEIREKYGYDTKYAAQIARLAYQGIEYLTDGKITLPMPQAERQMVMDIREGKYAYNSVLAILEDLENQVRAAARQSTLPPEPDWKSLGKLSQEIHEGTWWDKRREQDRGTAWWTQPTTS